MSFRRFVYWVSGRCLRWFYREHRVVGYGRVPASGPVLLVGNHPNDLPDVVAGLFVSPRLPRYIAMASPVTHPLAKWLYDKTYGSMGVIPVARVRDARKMKANGVDISAVNQAAHEAVVAAFAAGDMVAVFPEGRVHDGPHMGKFHQGIAKMVLSYLDAGASNDVTVVAVGHQYEAPRRWRSDVISVLGEPWSAREWRDSQRTEERGAAAFTETLRASVQGVTRNSHTQGEAFTRDVLVAAAAAMQAPWAPLDAAPGFVLRAAHTATLAHHEHSASEEPNNPAAVRVRTAAHTLAEAVEQAGGMGTSSVDMAHLLHALDVHKAGAPVPTIVLWMGLPAAAIGWALNGPVLPVVYAVSKKFIRQPCDRVAACFVPGLFVVLLWWGLVALLAAAVFFAIGWSPLWALPLLLMLPRFGDLALGWKEWLRGWQLVARVHKWSTPKRTALRAEAEVVREWVSRTVS